MPLPNDEKLIALSQDLIQAFDTIFGVHPGFRPAHAKGILLTGTFRPTPDAASLTRAPHMNSASTPVSVRFSNSTGLPLIPDNDPNAGPRGLGIRFHLGEHAHTDIIGHSANGFPVRTGQEFLEFLRALMATDLSKPAGSPLEAFLGSHPAALRFVQLPKPAPSSFAREEYFGLNAMRFTNKDGQSRYARYRVVPEEGIDYLSDLTAVAKGPNYLFDEIAERVPKGPVNFRVLAQLANEGDAVNDVTEQWPESRTLLELGSVTVTQVAAENAREQQWIIFDPIPRVDGIDPSDDPLLELRAAVYLLSGRRRRSAPKSAATA